jgi:hypothetical protein
VALRICRQSHAGLLPALSAVRDHGCPVPGRGKRSFPGRLHFLSQAMTSGAQP